MSSLKGTESLKIPFRDIKKATNNFKNEIGKGGYGPVYRGELTLSGKPIIAAVKQLQKDSVSGQGHKEFLMEIQLLSLYKHQNVVSLLGFCEEGNDRFLIYEHAEHGSLDKHLQPTKTCSFTWKERINICIDAAHGLDHLHNHVAEHERIIHRDIKSGNILLDHNWKAMISDFGLSKIGRANESITYLITNACGTQGYCDPEYFKTGILTKESDVYSFGVVLYEVLCGRLCHVNVKSLTENLVIDPALNNYLNSNSMNKFLEIASQCVLDDRKQRPSMGVVLEELEKALEFLEPKEAPELHVETLQTQSDEIEKSEVKNLSASNIETDNPLPSDYEQFIYYSNTKMMKNPQRDVVFPTKEEAYSILSTGVLIKVSSQVNIWFWITESSGKKCFVLSPTLLSYDKQLVNLGRVTSNESRIGNVLHLSSSKTIDMRFQVPKGSFSKNTTYGCYLVYKMPQHFVRETKVKMKLHDDDEGILMYLSISQSPGPDGVESSINKHKTLQMPQKRKDGWLEVNLGNKTDIQWMKMSMQHNQHFDQVLPRRESIWKSWCLCTSYNVLDDEVENVKDDSFSLEPHHFSNINVIMCPIDDAATELIVEGSERNH
ncbi:hypothetical protein L1987_57915 [Smallanthus sonchifolius]|uniref:Uncharacterized protein n=1 Tax=Smallanthus sonchifolius TaxID=185202 RepID=A0ACB9DEV1_9ASTR|nr:hypothetical protein L1987_57915 [Smallanthus sonchifolius]